MSHSVPAAGTSWRAVGKTIRGTGVGRFQSTKPPNIEIVHSKYWRSAHWTYEFQYFFEIAPNPQLKEQVFARNRMRHVAGDEATKIRTNVFGDVPSWFAPKEVTEYDIWILEDGTATSRF